MKLLLSDFSSLRDCVSGEREASEGREALRGSIRGKRGKDLGRGSFEDLLEGLERPFKGLEAQRAILIVRKANAIILFLFAAILGRS